jgi:hypothetical protein
MLAHPGRGRPGLHDLGVRGHIRLAQTDDSEARARSPLPNHAVLRSDRRLRRRIQSMWERIGRTGGEAAISPTCTRAAALVSRFSSPHESRLIAPIEYRVPVLVSASFAETGGDFELYTAAEVHLLLILTEC